MKFRGLSRKRNYIAICRGNCRFRGSSRKNADFAICRGKLQISRFLHHRDKQMPLQGIRILVPKIWTPEWCQKRELNTLRTTNLVYHKFSQTFD